MEVFAVVFLFFLFWLIVKVTKAIFKFAFAIMAIALICGLIGRI